MHVIAHSGISSRATENTQVKQNNRNQINTWLNLCIPLYLSFNLPVKPSSSYRACQKMSRSVFPEAFLNTWSIIGSCWCHVADVPLALNTHLNSYSGSALVIKYWILLTEAMLTFHSIIDWVLTASCYKGELGPTSLMMSQCLLPVTSVSSMSSDWSVASVTDSMMCIGDIQTTCQLSLLCLKWSSCHQGNKVGVGLIKLVK